MNKLKELFNESGILYKAGVKKYGKEGMKKIQQAAGKRASHAEIGAIKDKYEKESFELDEAHPKLAKQIDSRIWRTLKYEIADQIGELVKVGEDYSVFQNAQYTAKALKQIQKLWRKLG